DRRARPPRRTSRSRARGDKAGPCRHRRREGPRKRRESSLRPPCDPSLPTAQDPKCRVETTENPRQDRDEEDAGDLPLRRRPSCRGRAGRARPPAAKKPPPRGGGTSRGPRGGGPLRAEPEVEGLGRQLQRSHPGAAGSLREGLGETLTVMALKVPPTLSRTLRSTNAIESMIEICHDHSANVKRWRDGQMALRWCAAGMVEAGKQFRKVNGFLHLPALRTALDDYAERGVTPIDYNKEDAA